jgi:hypothetical protein
MTLEGSSESGALPVPSPPGACQFHPERAAVTRCNRCDAPLCSTCGQRSPVRQGVFCAPCVARMEATWAEQHRELPATPAAPDARCAFHAERRASSTCGRCGNFLCAACAIPSPWDERTYCKECLARLEAEGGGGLVPWEDRRESVMARFWRTVGQVLFSPGQFFQQLPARGYLPAVTFLYHTMIYAVPLTLLVTWLALPRGLVLPGTSRGELFGTLVLILVLSALVTPILQFVSAGWLHAHLYLFGARRGFQATYRIGAYLSALFFPYTLVSLVTMAARSQALGLVLMIAIFGYFLALMTIAATRVHRMSGALAFLAVLLTAVEAFLLWRFLLMPALLRGQGGGLYDF